MVSVVEQCTDSRFCELRVFGQALFIRTKTNVHVSPSNYYPYTQKEHCKKTNYISTNVEITYSLKYMYVSPKYMYHSWLECPDYACHVLGDSSFVVSQIRNIT